MIKLENNTILVVNNQELLDILQGKFDNLIIEKEIKGKLAKDLQQYDTTEDTIWVLKGYMFYSLSKDIKFWVGQEYRKSDKTGLTYYLENYKTLKEFWSIVNDINHEEFSEIMDEAYRVDNLIIINEFSDCTEYIKELINLVP